MDGWLLSQQHMMTLCFFLRPQHAICFSSCAYFDLSSIASAREVLLPLRFFHQDGDPDLSSTLFYPHETTLPHMIAIPIDYPISSMTVSREITWLDDMLR
jgi:hypothetical protein